MIVLLMLILLNSSKSTLLTICIDYNIIVFIVYFVNSVGDDSATLLYGYCFAGLTNIDTDTDNTRYQTKYKYIRSN